MTLPRDLLAEAWAMEPRRLEQLARVLSTLDTTALAGRRSSMQADSGPVLEKVDGVARIQINGVILKAVPWWMEWFGIAATSTEQVRELVAMAVEDDGVKAIVLLVDSPGGTVSGVQELAEDLAAARSLKPLSAEISDTAASAAYWLAAQADHISANASAAVGSIGVYTAIADMSRAAENEGVRVHVISSHPLKGAGVPGAPVSAEQLADIQRNVDRYAALFVEAVSRGRGSKTDAKKLATGQVWIGDEAVSLGLVDSIRSSKVAAPQISQMKPAPLRAAEDITMDAKEAAALAAENAILKAKLEASEANAKAIESKAKADVIAKYADRFMPAASASFDKLADVMGIDDLEKHLASLPKVVRDAVVSGVPAVDQKTADGLASYVSRLGKGGEPGAKQVARWLETSVDKIDRYAKVTGWRSDGKFVLEDGRIVTRAELDAAVAA